MLPNILNETWGSIVISVAILEDDLTMQNRLVDILKSWHFVRDIIAVDSNIRFESASKEMKFDILLADINVVDGNGVESIRLLKKISPQSKSIVISSDSRPEVIIEAIKAGATGYIYKDDSRLEIIEAIRSALQDESPISPGIAFTILKSLQDIEMSNGEKPEPPQRSTLSARETEIIQLISKGMSNDEVSHLLGLSKNTVPVHVRNIYRKLGAKRRTEAVFEARHLGIVI
jgi:DNA-binding NarL/FixJ family response regulator